MRRCTHVLPVFRQSSQPAMFSGSWVISIRSRCVQVSLMVTGG